MSQCCVAWPEWVMQALGLLYCDWEMQNGPLNFVLALALQLTAPPDVSLQVDK